MEIHKPQTDPISPSEIEIYSVSREQDGTLKISRRDFLGMALAVSGAFLAVGCQKDQELIQKNTPTSVSSPTPISTMTPKIDLPPVNLFSRAAEDSLVVEVLHAHDVVLLRNVTPGWVMVTAPSKKVGYVKREHVDFTRSYYSNTSDPDLKKPVDPAMGTPEPDTVYVVLTAAGAPPSSLPLTCPRFMANVPLVVPTMPKFSVTQMYSTIQPPVQPCSAFTNPCTCVGYVPCGCVGFINCGCVGYRPPCNQCSCVSFTNCACIGYRPPPPCSCLSYVPCGCVGYVPCSRT